MLLTTKLHDVFKIAYDKIRTGQLKTLIPFLSLFRLSGRPMNLQMHYQFSPMFNCVLPSKSIFMCGRQLGKSYSLCSSYALRNMLIPYYHTVIVQPRADQIQRMISTVYKPLINSCLVRDQFITSLQAGKLALREFNNGSLCYAEHMFQSADRLRGISGAASIAIDESLRGDCQLFVLDSSLKKIVKRRIKDIKQGNLLLSVGQSTVCRAIVSRDASFHGIRACFKLTTKSGRTLQATADHSLMTNYGRKTVKEIIEHVQAQTTGRTNRDAKECDSWLSTGGWVVQGVWQNDESYPVESWGSAIRLCAPQIHTITKCCSKRTVHNTESRLRKWCTQLVHINPEKSGNISLLVYPNAPSKLQAENSNTSILGSDNTSNSSSLVVHGRRLTRQNQQCCPILYKRILFGGESTTCNVATEQMGYSLEYPTSEAFFYRKHCSYTKPAKGRLSQISRIDSYVCARMHALQDNNNNGSLSSMRKGDWPWYGPILFRDLQEDCEARILRRDKRQISRPQHCQTSCIQSRTSRGYQAEEQGCLRCNDTGRATRSQSKDSGMSPQEQGCSKCIQESLACIQEERSCVSGKIESRTRCILSAEEARSGQTQENAGTAKSTAQERRRETTRAGIPASVQSHASGNSQSQAGKSECCTQSENSSEEGFLDPIVSIEYTGQHPVYDIEVQGTHNYILANGICSYNCQDIQYEFLDIAAQVMSASLFWGFSIYTGTPKTTDTTLALLWDRSSKAQWIIKCEHCGYFNVPNTEHDLLKMLGKTGPICAKCGKPLNLSNGGYVHAMPDRSNTFPGYHISQTIHPLHANFQNKWRTLLTKIQQYPELTLYNEVFGEPYDAATSPLTLADLQKTALDLKDSSGQPVVIQQPSDIYKVADQYRYVTVAVDWSGGGMISDSYTAYAVLGLRAKSDVIDVLYGKRIPKGASPTEQADQILSWIAGTGADAFAYDNGGAGFARLQIMNHQGLRSVPNLVIVPINYVRPHSGDVMQPHTAQRQSDLYYYTLDKSRSLAICIMAIKSCRIRMPAFAAQNQKAYQRDFLALRQDPRKSLGNQTVILIIKKPGVPDDFAHAVNFGCSQIWDHFGAYPRIGTKYDASILDYDQNNKPIMSDDDFGPRGDFQRFRDAVEAKSMVIQPDDYY